MIFLAFYESVTNRRTDGRTDQPTDGPTDRRTNRPSYRDARTHLKSVECGGVSVNLLVCNAFDHAFVKNDQHPVMIS